MKPGGSPLWPRLLKEAIEFRIGQVSLRVPTLEGVLAAKFASMTSLLRRPADRQHDGADFLRVVDANPKIDLDPLAQLGELVYSGEGKDLLKLVADARAGRRLDI